MSGSQIPVVDMRREIGAIKSRYGNKYHFKPEAYQEAANLWGFTNYNDCGVLTSCTTETTLKVKNCEAELRFIQSSKGYWLIGVSAMTSISGHCYMPSVFDNIGYASYEDARLAGVELLLRFFTNEAQGQNSCGGKSYQINCQEAVRMLQVEQQPQFDMFAPLGGSHGR